VHTKIFFEFFTFLLETFTALKKLQHVHKKCKRLLHYTVSYRLRSEMRTTDHGIASYGVEGRPPPVSPHTLLPITSEEYERGTLSIFRPGKLQARIVDGKILVAAPLQEGPYGVFYAFACQRWTFLTLFVLLDYRRHLLHQGQQWE
tara:strand:- start:7101 stop:7538 length:438 start_codon:yes stop_codon:yes gene_type:complete